MYHRCLMLPTVKDCNESQTRMRFAINQNLGKLIITNNYDNSEQDYN